jgi:chromosome partitioning related protein ParA
MKCIGIMSTKGGVGKTTLTANIGAMLADMGQKTLLIDADPQQSLSRFYSLREKAPFGLTHLFKTCNPAKTISRTSIEGLDIIIGDDKKVDGEIPSLLRESLANIQNLSAAINQLGDDYDYVLIDTQGTTNIMQDAVVYAADLLLSPIPPRVLDTREFLQGTIDLVKKYMPRPGCRPILGREPPRLAGLINGWDRTNSASKVVRNLRAKFDREADAAITVLETVIPHRNAYTVSSGQGEPAHRCDYTNRGATPSALITMLALIYELEPKLSNIAPHWEGITQGAVNSINAFMLNGHEFTPHSAQHPESAAETSVQEAAVGGDQ